MASSVLDRRSARTSACRRRPARCSSATRRPRRPESRPTRTPTAASTRRRRSSTAAPIRPRAASRSSRARRTTTASPSNDTAAAETRVDACVDALVAEIDPDAVDQTKCGVGKKKCVAKKLKSILKCYQKAETPGKPADPNTGGCIDKAQAKFDGGDRPDQGLLREARAEGGQRLPAPDTYQSPASGNARSVRRLRRDQRRAHIGHLPHRQRRAAMSALPLRRHPRHRQPERAG